MNITQGEFKDFYECSSGRSSRSSQILSRLSTSENLTSSLELLPADQSYDSKRNEDNSKDLPLESDDDKFLLSKFKVLNTLNLSDTNSVKTLSSSLSEYSFGSSSSDVECNDVETTEIDAFDQVASPEQLEMEKAIKKMKKLDHILMGKMKKEREVKHQRLMMQKDFHSELDKLRSESQTDSFSDVTNNTNKYLALMPPSQQLDVLLEQHQSVDDFEPIFQTQLYSYPSASTQNQHKEKRSSAKSRPKSTSSNGDKSEDKTSKDKKSHSNSSRGRRKKHDESKTNFIERNIQLAKDAGNLIAMTEEEKERLDYLLKDDSNDEDNEINDSNPFQVKTTGYGEGFLPGRNDVTQLEEIDERLRSLLTPAVFTSISSSSLMRRNFENTSYEMAEIGRKIAKSNLHEAVTPEQRLNEIEDKLSKLNENWKENKFYNGRPHLSTDQVQRLLDECSRATSPDSITTSNLSKLDFRETFASPRSYKSFDTSSFRSSVEIPSPEEESRISSRSSEATLTPDFDSPRSKPPALERNVLDELLSEAKLSLGITRLSDDDDVSDDVAVDNTSLS